MKRLILSLVLLCGLSVSESLAQAPNGPELEYVFQLKVKLGEAYGVGKTSHGERFIIPITGGTFEGEALKGTIIPGGADYQLSDKSNGRTEIEAIYDIRTDDGVNIHVRNKGLICASDKGFYFRAAPKFEAPNDSKYNWMNNCLFVCAPDFSGEQGTITLNIWKVK